MVLGSGDLPSGLVIGQSQIERILTSHRYGLSPPFSMSNCNLYFWGFGRKGALMVVDEGLIPGEGTSSRLACGWVTL